MLYNLFENRDFVSVFAVALLAEGVDRNRFAEEDERRELDVALLAEGVDRNKKASSVAPAPQVALLAEGVDRNCRFCCRGLPEVTSPSSRRAWIEIYTAPPPAGYVSRVALLAEGVDRNSSF